MLDSYDLETTVDAGKHRHVEFDIDTIGRRLREARERKGYGSAELDIMAEVGRGTTSRIEAGERPEVSAVVLSKLAATLGVHLDWLVHGRGDMHIKNAERKTPPPDPPIGGFLLQIDRLPGLRRWIERHPGEFTISAIARGLEKYEHLPPQSQEDGVPMGGWGSFFADVDALDARELPDGTAKVARLVRRQVGRRPKVR